MCYIVSLYRDFTFLALNLIQLLHYLLGIGSYSMLIIPFLTPAAIPIIEGLLACRTKLIITAPSPNKLNSMKDGALYIDAILENCKVLRLHTYVERSSNSNNRLDSKKANEAYYTLMTMLSAHYNQCEDIECPCKELWQVTNPVGIEGQTHVTRGNPWIVYAKYQLADLLNKYPKESFLLIMLSCVEYCEMKNKYKALFYLSKAMDTRPSISEIIDIFYIRDLIEEDMISQDWSHRIGQETKGAPVMNVKKQLMFMQLYNKFMQEIEHCTTYNVSFWSILLQELPDTFKLNEVGNHISSCLKRIHNFYGKIMDTDLSNINFLYKYGVFLKFIIFDELTANMIFSKLKTLKNTSEFGRRTKFGEMSLKNDKLMIMRVSGEANTLGKIIDVNFEICQRLSYEKEDLIGNRVKKVMPTMISQCHDEWMLRSYETEKFKKVGSYSHGFIKDRNGYFHFIEMVIQVIPSLKDGLTFLASCLINERMRLFTLVSDRDERKRAKPCLFICDGKGKITGINKETSNVFNIAQSFIDRNSELMIESVFPELNNKPVESQAYSKEGISFRVSRLQLRQLNLDSEASEQQIKPAAHDENDELFVWVKLIKEDYGEVDGINASAIIAVVVPLPKEDKEKIKNVNTFEHSVRDVESKHSPRVKQNEFIGFGVDDTDSLSMTSSASSHTSDSNAIKVFKATLYERKYPPAISLLKYTIWLLFAVLFVSCIIEWAISYQKIDDDKNFFNFCDNIAERFGLIGESSFFSRTKDLLINGMREITEPDLADFDDVQSHLISNINYLARRQSYLNNRQSNLPNCWYQKEHETINVQSLDSTANNTRPQVFQMAVQEFINNGLNVISYDNLADIRASCLNGCIGLNRSVSFMLLNGREILRITAEDSFNIIFNYFITVTDDGKIVVDLINGMAILAAVICFIIIIPRILNVVQQKSNVILIFADIPEKNIREMLNSINEISIHDIAYDKPQHFITKELNLEDKPVRVNTNSKEEKKQPTMTHTKMTEDIIGLGLGTNNNQEKPEDVAAKLEMQKLTKKRERLKESDNGIKRRSILTVSIIVAVICFFYAFSIGLTELLFKYYTELGENLKWIVLRKPYLTYQLVFLRELFINYSNKIETNLLEYNKLSRSIELKAQEFIVTGSGIAQNFKDASAKLNSDNFCDFIKDMLDKTGFETCLNVYQDTMKRGFEGNIFQIFANIDSLMTQFYNKKEQNLNTTVLLSDSKFQFCLYIKTKYLDLAFDKLVDAYIEDAYTFYENSKSWIGIKNGCFMGCLILVYIIVLTRLFSQLKEEIWQTKGLLNLIPTTFVMSNSELKAKFLSHQGI